MNGVRCAAGELDGVQEWGNKSEGGAVFESEDKDGFGEAVHDCQGFGFACEGETLALEVHGVAGAGLVGGVAGEESMSEASLALFIFAFRTVVQPSANIGAHRGPKIVSS